VVKGNSVWIDYLGFDSCGGNYSMHITANGGGASDSTLNNCTLTTNSIGFYSAFVSQGGSFQIDGAAAGGGASGCALSNCTFTGNSTAVAFNYGLNVFGGGAHDCTLNNCTLTGNSASGSRNAAFGGGASGCTLNNCTIKGNLVTGDYGSGGGCYNSTLGNCTLSGNSATGFFVYGGGTSGSTLSNCIAYFNTSTDDANYDYYSPLDHCCTTPLPANGVGNITNAPLFVDTNGWANLRLQSNSPCINAGDNSYVTNATDLDGNPRIVRGMVDIGAYEFQAPLSQISYAWLQQYGLPINANTDSADPDGDGVDNWHEWLAGTDPTNPLSSPAQLTIIPSGPNLILMWPTNAVGFTLQSTTNLGSSAVWSTNSPAPLVANGLNRVTNPITGGQQFYRLAQ